MKIKNRLINLVIVKDLSRLGRSHIMTGYYVESFFLENGIRFISMQEGYDNALNQAIKDSSTVIFACDDYYCKKSSIKIRNVLNDKLLIQKWSIIYINVAVMSQFKNKVDNY